MNVRLSPFAFQPGFPVKALAAMLAAIWLSGCGLNSAVTTLPRAADDLREQSRGFFPDREEDRAEE